MPQVDLYYSKTFLGHFTLIISDKVDLIVYRIHFVDADAEASKGGRIAWVTHKVAQVTGYASGKVLSDFESSPKAYKDRVNYGNDNRTLLRSWNITVPQMDNMIMWAHMLIQQQKKGHSGSYGYVIYSGNVDNCGSFAIKCLQQAGIQISLPYLKSWLQLPSLIKNDI